MAASARPLVLYLESYTCILKVRVELHLGREGSLIMNIQGQGGKSATISRVYTNVRKDLKVYDCLTFENV